MIQALWKLEHDSVGSKKAENWDKIAPEDIRLSWKELSKDVPLIQDCQIPRFIGKNLGNLNLSYQLLCFTDASKDAYAAVLYLKATCPAGNSNVKLLFCKARLAPIKAITIPRLELMGVLTGARLLKFASKELHIELSKKVLFSDSQCVLDWLNSKGQKPVFIERRLKEIRESMEQLKFSCRFVRTADNPADLASRGLPAAELIHNGFLVQWSFVVGQIRDRVACSKA